MIARSLCAYPHVVIRAALTLGIVCVLEGTSGAEPGGANTAQAVLDAVASQDVAAFARLVSTDVVVFTVWFQDPNCARQFSGVFELSADRHAGFLRCLATLGLRAAPDGLTRGAMLIYEPGVALRLDMFRGEIMTISSPWLGEPTAAPVMPDELARHVIGDNPAIELEPAIRGAIAIARAPATVLFVELATCVDKAGKLESTRIIRRSPSYDGYVHAVEAAAAARNFTPFIAHGKPVRTCAVELFTYPAERGYKAVPARPYIPPPHPEVVAAEDATIQAWLDALSKQDAEVFARLLPKTAEISSLWFDSAPCAKQFSGRFAPTDENRGALLKCLAGLGVHASPVGLRRATSALIADQLSVVYEPGVTMYVDIHDGAIVSISTDLQYSADPDAAPITQEALEAHRISGTATIEPEPAVRDALASSLHDAAFVQLLACVDRAGKLESVRVVQRSREFDDYVRAVIAATAKWKFKPFQVHGKAVRACAVELIAYPADRRDHLLHPRPAPPPPPPPPPPAPPRNVSPTALDANRIAGEKNIVPDDVTRTEIYSSGKDKLIGSYKLCITVDGNIASVTQLKSTGFAPYDQKIMNTIRSGWRYRPFMVDGKAAPVCTAVTFIYSQVPALPQGGPEPRPPARRPPSTPPP